MLLLIVIYYFARAPLLGSRESNVIVWRLRNVMVALCDGYDVQLNYFPPYIYSMKAIEFFLLFQSCDWLGAQLSQLYGMTLIRNKYF